MATLDDVGKWIKFPEKTKTTFPVHGASSSTRTCGLTECLIHCRGFCTVLCLIQKLISQQIKGSKWFIYMSYRILCHLEADGLTKR